jgi:DinB superfamily/Pentapeptide repeats (8 copies)
VREIAGEDWSGARFRNVDLSGARFRNVDLHGVKMVDAMLVDADMSGVIDGLKVNGIEVAPLIKAELERRYPSRTALFASDAAGLQDACRSIESQWQVTLERARRLPDTHLHERVDEEWSFVETLRHLIFVTDAWIGRVVIGTPNPFHPIGLPPDFVGDGETYGIDPHADPDLDIVLDVRASRMGLLSNVVESAWPDELQRVCDPNPAPGYPPTTQHRVLDCIWTVFDEEWWHHQFAARDLESLERDHGRS